jgi:hypothetical protein
MKTLFAFLFFLGIASAHADELDDLIERKASLEDVVRSLKAMVAPGTIDKVIDMKRRAMAHFPLSVAYRPLLDDGLTPIANADYRQKTLELLAETFAFFLNSAPEPELQDVFYLVENSIGLKAEQRLDLRRQVLIRFPEAHSEIIKRMGSRDEKEGILNLYSEVMSERLCTHLMVEPRNHLPVLTLVREIPKTIEYQGLESTVLTMTLDCLERKFDALPNQAEGWELTSIFWTLNQAFSLKTPLALKPKLAAYLREALLRYFATRPASRVVYKELSFLSRIKAEGHDFDLLRTKYLQSAALTRLEDELGPRLPKPVKVIKGNFDCPVCFETVEPARVHQLTNCRHRICVDCWKDYVASKANDNSGSAGCPDPDCEAFVAREDFEHVGLDEGRLLVLRSAEIYDAVRKIPGAKICSSPNCPDAFVPEKPAHVVAKIVSPFKQLIAPFMLPQSAECKTCGDAFCAACGKLHPTMSCKRSERVQKRNVIEQEKMKRGANTKVKFCPGCGVLIEKGEGCNHMTCSSCWREFTWEHKK